MTVIPADDILDLLRSLVDKSLVVYEERDGVGRYRLLETVRQYAGERLAEGGETEALRDRHLSWCVALAEDAEPRLRGHAQRIWLMRLETEHDNLRAGLAWGAASASGAEQTLRLAGSLWYFWLVRGHWAEAQKQLTAALSREGAERSTVARVRALQGLASLALNHDDYETAHSLSEQMLTISREIGDPVGEADSLTLLGNAIFYPFQGHMIKIDPRGTEAACSYFEQSLAICRANGYRFGEASSYSGLGYSKKAQQDYAAAGSYFEQSLAIRREIGDSLGQGLSLRNLGWAKFCQGDCEAAASYYEQALMVYSENENPFNEAMTLSSLGHLALFQADWEAADSYFKQAMTIYRKLGLRDGELQGLYMLGCVKHQQGDLESARFFIEESLAVSRELGNSHMEVWNLAVLGQTARVQNRLTEARAILVQCLTFLRQIDYPELEAATLAGWADLMLAEGDAAQAARFAGTAQAGREAHSFFVYPHQKVRYERTISAARAALGEEAFTAAWEAGRAMTMDEAIEFALETPIP